MKAKVTEISCLFLTFCRSFSSSLNCVNFETFIIAALNLAEMTCKFIPQKLFNYTNPDWLVIVTPMSPTL